MTNYYRFTVKRLKLFKKMADFSNSEDVIKYSKILKKRQPNFCMIIDDVKTDPRCLAAHRFCTLFCSLALEHAEKWIGTHAEYDKRNFKGGKS